MTTREQDCAIEALSLSEGGAPIQVSEGYEDGVVKATIQCGPEFSIDRWGGVKRLGLNWSVRWDS